MENARRLRKGLKDAPLLDKSLKVPLAQHPRAEIDASYSAYGEHPVDEPDAWGDLASFRRAAAAS